VYTNSIEHNVKTLEAKYDLSRKSATEQKERHLRMFRPNLENPANKKSTEDLNHAEHARSEKLKEVSYPPPISFNSLTKMSVAD